MLGLMFTGRWIRFCHLCNEVIYYPTEHLLLFCRKTNEFRESLWLRLIFKFGLNFFDQFISETPKGQLELLFSGCAKILNKETVKDCVKIFVLTLGKIKRVFSEENYVPPTV